MKTDLQLSPRRAMSFRPAAAIFSVNPYTSPIKIAMRSRRAVLQKTREPDSR
jgi:hypothetical protein